LQVGRAFGLIASAIFFILALGRLPIADATAMVFASPLFVTVLSALLLRERVSPLRWTIVVMGFMGVLIVMRPGSASFQLAALLPVASSVAWALAVICTRRVSQTDSVASTISHSAVIGCAVLSVLALPAFVRPTLHEALLLVMMSVAWCSAQWLTVKAYHRAEASTLAPFAYSQVLFATAVGVLVFGQWPDVGAMAGIVLILSCGAVAVWEGARRIGLRAAEEEAVR
jgi:drug/metabolite transporter (DMT)-like permease